MLKASFGIALLISIISSLNSAPASDRLQIEWIGPVTNCTNGNEQKLESCLRKSFVDLKPKVKKRIEELGLGDLNPIKFDSFNYDFNQGPIKLNVLTKDVKLFGVPNYSLTKLKVDAYKGSISFVYEAPIIKYEANYKVGGNVLFFPVKGAGPVSFELYEVKLQGKVNFLKTKNKEGQTVLQAEKAKIESGTIHNIKNAHISGIFDKNPLFSAVVQYFANNYGSQIFELVKKDVGKYTEDAMTNSILNPILTKIPKLAQFLPSS